MAAATLAACSAPRRKKVDVRDVAEDDRRPPRPAPDDRDAYDPLPEGKTPPGRVYAHTAGTLYLFDPLIQKLTTIGPFQCLNEEDRMLDVALDRHGVMYGTSDDGFLQIDPRDGSCAYVKEDPFAGYPNSLTFVPAGTVDRTEEALVGYLFTPGTSYATTYARIDLDGNIDPIGDLNEPGAAIKYHSSGDLIALIRTGKAYLTVKKMTPGDVEGNDYLAEIDPTSGKIKAILGETGHKDLYGLGQWGGTGYGFSAAGEIISLDLQTGASTVLFRLVEDDVAGSWYGAGVTTDSPTQL